MENGIEGNKRGKLYNDENFLKRLASNLNNIHIGDFVFFATNDISGNQFTHVAVVVGRGYDNQRSIEAPVIADADGPEAPRFIYETENVSIMWVVIVHHHFQ